VTLDRAKKYLIDVIVANDIEDRKSGVIDAYMCILKALEQPSQSKWVSKKEALPEDVGTYLILTEYGEYDISEFVKECDCDWGRFDYDPGIVAWQSIEPYDSEGEI